MKFKKNSCLLLQHTIYRKRYKNKKCQIFLIPVSVVAVNRGRKRLNPFRITATKVKFVKRTAVCVGPCARPHTHTHTHTHACAREDYIATKGILGELMAVCRLTKVLKYCIRHVDRIHRDIRLHWMTECRRAGKEWMKLDRNGPWIFLQLCDAFMVVAVFLAFLELFVAETSSCSQFMVPAFRFLHTCYLQWSDLSSLCMFLYYCTCCTFH
jgi:hypothetical protein